MFTLCLVGAVGQALSLLFSVGFCDILYVDENGSGSNGNSWATAYTTLYEALAELKPRHDSIYIAQGTYYRDSSASNFACFNFTESVNVYGGFTGTEASENDRPSPRASTILDGEYSCYHILHLNGKARSSTFDGIIFKRGKAVVTGGADGTDWRQNGGVLAIEGSNYDISFTQCDFEQNIASQGGVFWLATRAIITLTNCNFNNNQAIASKYLGGYGGAIFSTWAATINCINCNFRSNNATYRGGAIYGDYGAINIFTDSLFISNSALEGHGGALMFEDRNSQTDGTFVNLSNVEFTSNTAYQYGGAVCWFNGPFISMQDCTFDSNDAALGGAVVNFDDIIYLSERGNSYVTASDTTYNDSLPGVTDLVSLPPVTGTYDITVAELLSELYDNRAVTSAYNTNRTQSGTICYVDERVISCSNNCGGSWAQAYDTIQECIDSIGSGGGEIWVAQGTYVPTEAPSWAQGTNAPYYSFVMQPDIAMYGGFDGTETLRNERNWRDNPTYLSCLFVGDRANRNCSIIMDAEVGNIVDGFIFYGSRRSGGRSRRRRGLNIDGMEEFDSDIWDDEETRRNLQQDPQNQEGGAYTTTLLDVVASRSSGRGGGVFSNGTDIVIVNSIFYDLQATKGGGVYCIGYYDETTTKSPTIINAVFLDNVAQRGAAITGDVYCHYVCNYCSFIANRCSEKGGAIYLDYNCDPHMNHTVWHNNEAMESGGCMAADGLSDVIMYDMTLYNNYAGWEGGCMYSGTHGASNPQYFTFLEANFYDNEAPYGFDDIWLWTGGALEIEYVSDTTNEPTRVPTSVPTNVPTGNPVTPELTEASESQETTTIPLSSALPTEASSEPNTLSTTATTGTTGTAADAAETTTEFSEQSELSTSRTPAHAETTLFSPVSTVASDLSETTSLPTGLEAISSTSVEIETILTSTASTGSATDAAGETIGTIETFETSVASVHVSVTNTSRATGAVSTSAAAATAATDAAVPYYEIITRVLVRYAADAGVELNDTNIAQRVREIVTDLINNLLNSQRRRMASGDEEESLIVTTEYSNDDGEISLDIKVSTSSEADMQQVGNYLDAQEFEQDMEDVFETLISDNVVGTGSAALEEVQTEAVTVTDVVNNVSIELSDSATDTVTDTTDTTEAPDGPQEEGDEANEEDEGVFENIWNILGAVFGALLVCVLCIACVLRNRCKEKKKDEEDDRDWGPKFAVVKSSNAEHSDSDNKREIEFGQALDQAHHKSSKDAMTSKGTKMVPMPTKSSDSISDGETGSDDTQTDGTDGTDASDGGDAEAAGETRARLGSRRKRKRLKTASVDMGNWSSELKAAPNERK